MVVVVQTLNSFRRAVALVMCVAVLSYWLTLWVLPACRNLPVYTSNRPSYSSDVPLHTKDPQTIFWNAPKRALPETYWWHRILEAGRYQQLTCYSPPRPEQLQFAAAGWQLLPLTPGHLHLYSAHWDDRFQEPLVRVLVYCDVAPLPELVCLLWYEDEGAPDTVTARVVYAWRVQWGGPKDGVNEPYILGCPARRHRPSSQRPPAAVSIVLSTHLCSTPTNILNVQGVPGTIPKVPHREVKERSDHTQSVCVCLKWIQFSEDISLALVEWIEFLREFGAKKIFTFVIHAEPNTRRVLSHYEASGFVDVTEFSHVPYLRGSFKASQQDFLDFRSELLPLNDCLYRARAFACDWITPLDTDEIIAPHANYRTWQQVINATLDNNYNIDALLARHYYFLDTEQRNLTSTLPYMRMMSHIWRARMPSSPYYSLKSFHNTSSVVAVHNHSPMVCERRSTGGMCMYIRIPTDIARVHHYRTECNHPLSECPPSGDTVQDNTLAQYSGVSVRVEHVLRFLNITLPHT